MLLHIIYIWAVQIVFCTKRIRLTHLKWRMKLLCCGKIKSLTNVEQKSMNNCTILYRQIYFGFVSFYWLLWSCLAIVIFSICQILRIVLYQLILLCDVYLFHWKTPEDSLRVQWLKCCDSSNQIMTLVWW